MHKKGFINVIITLCLLLALSSVGGIVWLSMKEDSKDKIGYTEPEWTGTITSGYSWEAHASYDGGGSRVIGYGGFPENKSSYGPIPYKTYYLKYDDSNLWSFVFKNWTYHKHETRDCIYYKIWEITHTYYVGSGWLPAPQTKIHSWKENQPKPTPPPRKPTPPPAPDPEYKYSTSWYSSQVVSTYKDKFVCKALLKPYTIAWKPEPELTMNLAKTLIHTFLLSWQY